MADARPHVAAHAVLDAARTIASQPPIYVIDSHRPISDEAHLAVDRLAAAPKPAGSQRSVWP